MDVSSGLQKCADNVAPGSPQSELAVGGETFEKKKAGKSQKPLQSFLYLCVWGFMKLSGCSPECQGSTGALSLDVFRQVLHGQLLRVL